MRERGASYLGFRVPDSSCPWKGRGFDFLSGKRRPSGPRKSGEIRHPRPRARLKRSTSHCDVGILFPLRFYNPNLTCGGYYKTTSPLADIFLLKQFCDPLNQASPFGRAKTQKQDPVVRSRREPPQVGEIQVLSNQESRFLLRCFPNLRVSMAQKEFTMKRMNVVSKVLEEGCQPIRKILVQLDLHRMCGTAGTGKSSSAEAAANEMAA